MDELTNSFQNYVQRHPEVDTTAGAAIRVALDRLGLGMDSEHTNATPYRFTRYVQSLLGPKGGTDPVHITSFSNENPHIDHMVVIPNITFWSACSHHMLPFFGTIAVGYIPNDILAGLSKIPLVVRHIAKGLWMQEHLANTIADVFSQSLKPLALAVRIEAQHTCQLLDIKQPPIPLMITTVLKGNFLLNPSAKAEFEAEVHRYSR